MSVYLMPQPRNMVIAEEGIFFDASVLHAQILCPEKDDRLLSCAQSLLGSAEMLTAAGDYRLCAGDVIDAPDAPDHLEGYALATKAQSVCIRARTAQGLFYGMQTLRQLIEAESFAAVTIIDWPDIPLRSDYLDLRSIYPTFERLLHFMKEMAAYKFNTVVIEYENKLPFPNLQKLEDALNDYPGIRNARCCLTMTQKLFWSVTATFESDHPVDREKLNDYLKTQCEPSLMPAVMVEYSEK